MAKVLPCPQRSTLSAACVVVFRHSPWRSSVRGSTYLQASADGRRAFPRRHEQRSCAAGTVLAVTASSSGVPLFRRVRHACAQSGTAGSAASCAGRGRPTCRKPRRRTAIAPVRLPSSAGPITSLVAGSPRQRSGRQAVACGACVAADPGAGSLLAGTGPRVSVSAVKLLSYSLYERCSYLARVRQGRVFAA
jgi:hypothetical protein